MIIPVLERLFLGNKKRVFNSAIELHLKMLWTIPLDENLQKVYPGLSADKAKLVSNEVIDLMEFSIPLFEDVYNGIREYSPVCSLIKEKHPLISNKNLSSLSSIGGYSASRN